MCGFAGIVTFDDRYRIDRDTLARMALAIAHRGPDGQDLWINHSSEVNPENPQCALAFARLAILDLDPRAMQPMTDGRRWLVFNGEIYNFRELRRELDARDPNLHWKTSSDTEVILKAYDAWGEGCLERFNGMFAIVIWDPAARTLFLARDRMGQKPLYVATSPDHRAVAFASELAALRPLNWIDFATERLALMEFLQTGYITAPATIYRGAKKLPPANWTKFGGKGPLEFESYFDPNPPPDGRSGSISPAAVRGLVQTAVTRQLVADVPVGCFLSGGIDSSIIAATMKQAAGREQKVHTFAIGFDDPRYDETPYAREVAAHLGTEHREFIVKPDAASDLPKLATVFGEPFGDSSALPTHYLSRETRQHVKVALSGDGGDELFGGYDRYRAMAFGRAGRRVPTFIRNALGSLPSTHPKSKLTRLKRFTLTLNLPDPQRYSAYMDLFDADQIKSLGLENVHPQLVERTYLRLQNGRDPVQAALATDRATYLPEDLLTKVDRASMLHALEIRSPFMDDELVLAAAGLSREQLIGGGPKRLLREAFAGDLPASVFRRRKMGFAVPIGDWLRGSLRSMMYDLLQATDSFAASNFRATAIAQLMDSHIIGKADHSQRLYALMMLELWWRGR
ncbi:MAG: asparagine synthase (glutamine-hydrolyzing) [Planctomycetota bacterium]|nr:asparagine synthase (glutamine-hydrolyzing) [Planctomycetota bacterium]